MAQTEVRGGPLKNPPSAKDFLLVYCTVPDEKTGKSLSHHLLSKKLIACANLLPEGRSFYEWKGKLESETERVLICKTKKSCYRRVEEEITKKHPYECPCIVALPLSEGHPSFLKWMDEQLGL